MIRFERLKMASSRVLLSAVGMVVMLAGAAACGEAAPVEGPSDPAVSVELERRAGLGKADDAGSCQDACGGQSDHGACWCDDLCAKYGDCCADKKALCDQDVPCFAAGCSGQVCSEDPDVITICDMRPEYACLQAHGDCARQPDGECGWTPSPALSECLDAASQVCPLVLCAIDCPDGYVLGADGCPTCTCLPPAEPAPESCHGSCGGQSQTGSCYCDDECEGFGDCCADKEAVCAPEEPAPAPCYVGGCSAQLCGEEEGLISTCEWKDEYACYQDPAATCERQADGACGWTQTPELLACLDDVATACHEVLCKIACPFGWAIDDKGCEYCACAPAPTTCEGSCGGQAAEGCWCDAFCDVWGDCCPGKHAICGP